MRDIKTFALAVICAFFAFALAADAAQTAHRSGGRGRSTGGQHVSRSKSLRRTSSRFRHHGAPKSHTFKNSSRQGLHRGGLSGPGGYFRSGHSQLSHRFGGRKGTDDFPHQSKHAGRQARRGQGRSGHQRLGRHGRHRSARHLRYYRQGYYRNGYYPWQSGLYVGIGVGAGDFRLTGRYGCCYRYPAYTSYSTTYWPMYTQSQTTDDHVGTAPVKPADVRLDVVYESRLSPMFGGRGLVGPDFSIGEAKLRDGAFAVAALAFRRSLIADPGDPAATIALSLALSGEGNYAAATRALRQGLTKMSNLDRLQLDPEQAFGTLERYKRMVARLSEQAGERPEDMGLWFLLGFLDCSAGRFDEASERLWPVYEADNEDVLARDLLLEVERRKRASREDVDGGERP